MIASHYKKLLMEARKDMLEDIKTALRLGNVGIAKEIGEASATLKKNIETKDYSRTDAWIAHHTAVQKAARTGTNTPPPWN